MNEEDDDGWDVGMEVEPAAEVQEPQVAPAAEVQEPQAEKDTAQQENIDAMGTLGEDLSSLGSAAAKALRFGGWFGSGDAAKPSESTSAPSADALAEAVDKLHSDEPEPSNEASARGFFGGIVKSAPKALWEQAKAELKGAFTEDDENNPDFNKSEENRVDEQVPGGEEGAREKSISPHGNHSENSQGKEVPGRGLLGMFAAAAQQAKAEIQGVWRDDDEWREDNAGFPRASVDGPLLAQDEYPHADSEQPTSFSRLPAPTGDDLEAEKKTQPGIAQKLAKAEAYIEELESALKSKDADCVAEADRNKAQIAELEKELSNSKSLAASVPQDDPEVATARIVELEAVVRNLEKDLEHMTCNISAAEEKSLFLQASLTQQEVRSTEFASEVESGNEQISELQNVLRNSQAASDGQKVELDASNQKIIELQTALMNLEADSGFAASQAADASQERIAELEATLSDRSNLLAAASSDFEAARQKIEELEAAASSDFEAVVSSDCDAAKRKIEELEAAISDRIISSAHAASELEKSTQEVEELKQIVAEYHLASETAKSEAQAAKSRTAQLEAAALENEKVAESAISFEVQDLQATIAELEVALKEKCDALSELALEDEVANSKTAQLEAACQAAQHRVTELESASHERDVGFEQHLDEMKVANARLEETLKAAQHRVTELESASHEREVGFEQHLDETKVANARLEETLKAAQHRVTELESASHERDAGFEQHQEEAKVANARLEETLKATQHRVTELESASHGREAGFEQHLEETKVANARLEETLKAAQQRVTELESASHERDAGFEQQIEETNVANARLEETLKARESASQQLEQSRTGELEALRRRATELESVLREREAGLERQFEQTNAANTRAVELENALQVLQQRASELESLLREQEAAHQMQQEQLIAANARLEAEQQRHADHHPAVPNGAGPSEEVLRLHGELEQQRALLEQTSKEKNELANARTVLVGKLQEVGRVAMSSAEDLANAEEELSRAKEEATANAAARDAIAERLAEAQRQLELEAASSTACISDLEATLAIATSKLAETRESPADNADNNVDLLKAALEEKDSIIRQMSQSAEAKTLTSQGQAASLRSQLEAESASLAEERRRNVELANELEDAKTAKIQAMQQAAKLQQSEEKFMEMKQTSQELQALRYKGIHAPAEKPSSVPEAAALAIFGDLELGRSGVTLNEIGFGDLPALQCADKALQGLAVLMAWRSDLRLAVFGVWLLCHLLYMLGVLYTKFM